MSEKETTPSPEIVALEAEVVLTREQLASTVDALVEQVDPRRQAARAAARGRRLMFDATDPAALPEDRARARKIVAVAGVVVVLVVAGIVRKATRH
ncbi:DUF3618 domain-containing protein [Cellulomonas wangsupingiae]|uniref:DUF3618 domain-containing protein n=1 Tax=Cellulomonas wangsupingiae TaxID=2968085 RepID=A0ABY5K308_9CELL|nr:DUF3618 domain-containing protein [Cellulomonas wangsupingiae]MCC2335385.1 DUF3618 domain-containing protein [Cellulomonas wangsupingiae]MCM0640083.1 DUF3618 domain-containing protein [Cellulomonas wangsupingiae]UUI64438.1 DUF3618 domain-containing protein [Cellulomonas wangsupingiae]